MSIKSQEDKKLAAHPWTARQRRSARSRKTRKMDRSRYAPLPKTAKRFGHSHEATRCAETNEPINKGDKIMFDPATKNIYGATSKKYVQACASV